MKPGYFPKATWEVGILTFREGIQFQNWWTQKLFSKQTGT